MQMFLMLTFLWIGVVSGWMWTWSAWSWPSRMLGLAWSAISVAGSYVTAKVSSLGMLVSQGWFLFDVAMVCAVLLGCLQQGSFGL